MRTTMNVVLKDIDMDWDRMHEAKKLLVMSIWSTPSSPLWRIVSLIDSVQRAAIEDGHWSFPERSHIVRKSDVLKLEVRDGDLCWDQERAVGMEWRNGEWVDIPYTLWAARHYERS